MTLRGTDDDPRPMKLLGRILGRTTARVEHLSIPPVEGMQSIWAMSSYNERTRLLGAMYEATAEWGTPIARNVVDVRAAFTLGAGLQAVARDDKTDATRELEFINAFLDYNGFDEETAQSWAKEAEIEGKFLAVLAVPKDRTAGQIKARFLSWTKHNYTVKANPDDYAEFTLVNYNLKGVEQEIHPDVFVYQPFGGRSHSVNDTPSKCAAVVECFSAIHKALDDWRKTNRLFASPTPYFKCQNRAESQALLADLQKLNWKVGQFLAGTADYSLMGLDSAGVQSIKDEITTNAQIISGNTGIPPHFLGFPELMSNRATADSLLDVVAASVVRERRLWEGFYSELFDKAIRLANTTYGLGMREGTVVAHIPELSSEALTALKDTWLPLYEANCLSLETLLTKIPLLADPDAELKRLQKAQAEAAVEAMKTLKAQDNNAGDDQ